MRRLIKSAEPEEYKLQKKKLEEKNYDKTEVSWFLTKLRKTNIPKILMEETQSKCAYCETKITLQNYSLEMFYPRSKFKEKAYEWINLFICCSNCNSYKANKFPMDNEGKPLLIHPFIDDPEEHLVVAFEDGSLKPLTERGEITIDIIGLNRFDLRFRRKSAIDSIESIIKNPTIKNLPDTKFEFYGSIKNFITRSLSSMGEIKYRDEIPFDLYSNSETDADRKMKLNRYRRKTIYLESIKISNFKAINLLSIKFNKFEIESRVPCLMLLGENGVGKTSVIQAVSLALLSKESPDLDNLLNKNKDLIKDQINFAEIEIQYSEKEVSHLKIFQGSKEVHNTGQKIPILAYGAIRIERKIPLHKEHIEFIMNPNRIHNAFNPRGVLINANYWLITLTPEEFNIVKEILEELLQLNESGEILERNATSVFVAKGRVKVKIDLWSEGRRNVLVLVCDILAHLSALWDKGNLHKEDIKEYSAVVMIDEIGAHLHPTWKMKIVSQLRKTFPKLQFICTTHDPLCLKGFKQGEIVVLRKDKDGKVFMVNPEDLPNPEAMRADQLLTSPYFGLSSTIDPKIEEDFEEYYDLLARDKSLNKDEQNRLEYLKTELGKSERFGDTDREQLYYEVIDKVLAERKSQDQLKEISMREDILQRINKILGEKEK